MNCLYLTCKKLAMDCDAFCAQHREEYGLYMPMTYTQAYEKAKARFEATGEKHFVYRHKHIGNLHKGYGTSRVTSRNWVHAIFAEVIFPNEGLVSTNTAQDLMFHVIHGSESATESKEAHDERSN